MKHRIIKITLNDGTIQYYAQVKKNWFSKWKFISPISGILRENVRDNIIDFVDFCHDKLVTLDKAQRILDLHKEQLESDRLSKIQKTEVIKSN